MVIKWVRQFKTTGSVVPGKMGGHRPKNMRGDHRGWLVERRRGAAFTLRGLVRALGERGLKVDYRSVWEFVHAEKLMRSSVICQWDFDRDRQIVRRAVGDRRDRHCGRTRFVTLGAPTRPSVRL
jgi:hypothetical protein